MSTIEQANLAAVLPREALAVVEAEGAVVVVDRATERAREPPEPAAPGEPVHDAASQVKKTIC